MKPNDKAIDADFEASAISVNGSVFGRVSRSTMKEILEAAYAAQFQSGDYAGLIARLRDWGAMNYKICNEAADALDAVLAERDALNFELAARKEWPQARAEMLEELAKVRAERDDLLAHLAPVDDDILREIAAMHFARIDGHSDNWDRYVDEAKDYIDAIRPHIEAAERERCAKIAEGSFYFDIEICLNSTKKEMTAHVAKAIAAAIRSGK